MDNQFGEYVKDLSAVAVNYKNEKYVVNEIAPQIAVGSASFRYSVWDKNNSLTVPETAISRTSKANEVDFSATQASETVRDHALSHLVSNKDIEEYDRAELNANELLASVADNLTGIMYLRKELEAASVIQDSSKYASSNVKTYAAADSWAKDTSDPLADIEDAISSGIVAYNRIWLANDAWVRFRRHPKVIARFYSGATVNRSVTKEMVAEELGLDKVVVGESRVLSSLPGKTASVRSVWSASAGLYLFEQPFGTSAARTFAFDAYLANNGQKLAVFRKDVAPTEAGTRGGVRISVAEDSVTVISAPDFGFLFKNVLAA